jgi:hypothetical protein
MCRETRQDSIRDNNLQIKTMKYPTAWSPYGYCLPALCMAKTVCLWASPTCNADCHWLSGVANGLYRSAHA